jgi:pyruvate formate lyase activating enzyme
MIQNSTLPTGTVFDIKKYAIHDGPGIRTTIFFQGCPLSCWWCHNPESQSHRPVLLYRANRCALCGTCVETCPQDGIQLFLAGELRSRGAAEPGQWDDKKMPGLGVIEANSGYAITDRTKCSVCGSCAEICYHGAREVSGKVLGVKEVMAEIERDLPFYDQSGGGVTFSGGEPLMQPDFLAALLRACKAREIHTVVDTSGHTTWQVIDGLRRDIDLFLYDLKLIDNQRHKKYTGISNELILHNLQRLAQSGAQLEIRIPLIPGINDDRENLERSAELIAGLPGVKGVELMAYHDIAAAKYASLGLVYRLSDIKPPTEDDMQEAARVFLDHGLIVKTS